MHRTLFTLFVIGILLIACAPTQDSPAVDVIPAMDSVPDTGYTHPAEHASPSDLAAASASNGLLPADEANA